jgi:hypothetical protein
VPEKIQAMDLVKDIEPGNTCIWAKAILLWKLDSEFRVLSELPHIICFSRECSNGNQFLPCILHLWTGLHPIPVWERFIGSKRPPSIG